MTLTVKHAFTSGKADGVDPTLVQPSNWNANHSLTGALANYIGGLTMSTAGSSATAAIAAGEAAASDNSDMLTIASPLSKTTGAWAVGNAAGGLDTGAIAANTWYHTYLIKRPDTGVVDALYSLNASAPSLPANYTLKRRIGAMKTNGSSQWTKFFQYGDLFLWDVMVKDVNTTISISTAQLFTLSVPTGINALANFTPQLDIGSANEAFIFTTPDQTDTALSSSALTFSLSTTAEARVNVPISIMTNTSAQVRGRAQFGNGISFSIYTTGWVDPRGRY